jgi:hypothetical protein
MEPVRATWTDERMDNLAGRMDNGFNRVDQDLRALCVEMKTEFAAVRSELKSEIGGLRAETNARFDSLQRTMLQLGGGMIATLVVGFASILVAHA